MIPHPECKPVWIDVLLYRGRGFGSSLIRWQTRSPYTHAALRFPGPACQGPAGDVIIEALQGCGVIRRRWNEDDDGLCDAYRVGWISDEGYALAKEWAFAQVGKPYDWLAIARFITRRRHYSGARWFCSELVFETFLRADVRLLARTEAWEVSPGMLARSPILTERVF